MTVLKKNSRDSERKGCKLNAKWLGKYTITDIRGNCARIQNSDDEKIIKCLINLSKLKPYLEFNKIVNKPINILKNLKDCINKTYKIGPYKIGPYIINKESILSIDSWLDDQIINSYLYILLNQYKNNCHYIDSNCHYIPIGKIIIMESVNSMMIQI